MDLTSLSSLLEESQRLRVFDVALRMWTINALRDCDEVCVMTYHDSLTLDLDFDKLLHLHLKSYITIHRTN